MSKREVQKTLRGLAGRSIKDEKTTEWLARNLAKIKSSMMGNSFIANNKRVLKKPILSPGVMVFFGYTPKGKDYLPFWDEFPVVVVLDCNSDSILGLNLHYLAPATRAKFLNRLIRRASEPEWHLKDGKVKLATFDISYPLIKNNSEFDVTPSPKYTYEHCIKRYLYTGIVTKVALIDQSDWTKVPFFPLDKFRGMSREEVWKLTR